MIYCICIHYNATGGAMEIERKKETPTKGERIAKVIARAGVASRRNVEKLIAEGRVSVNGTVIQSPALNVLLSAKILVDGNPIAMPDPPRIWRYHKARGLVTTEFDPQGRRTVFSSLSKSLPRVMSIGRLDINTEGLLLLTNDGGLKRYLELPQTGWIRRYRVRAFGRVNMTKIEKIKSGITLEGVKYQGIEIDMERQQGDNQWLTMSLKEGKNREIKNLLEYAGLQVNRLIRLSFGAFQLGSLETGKIEEVPRRVLKEQLGKAWIDLNEGRVPEPPSKKHKPSTKQKNKKFDERKKINAHHSRKMEVKKIKKS